MDDRRSVFRDWLSDIERLQERLRQAASLPEKEALLEAVERAKTRLQGLVAAEDRDAGSPVQAPADEI